MRRTLFTLASASLMLIAQGCASHDDAKPVPQAQTAPAPVPSSPTKIYMMQSGGKDVLRLAAPASAPCTLSDGEFDMQSRDGYVNIWLMRDARTLAEGVQQAPSRITGEFKDFKATTTTTMSLPGGAATRIYGMGLEADDNDPGKADLIVFQKGGRVFVACTHGENLRSSAQELMVQLVQTATAP